MLILTRKRNESIIIGDDIEIIITDIGEDKVRIGIEAPCDLKILRKELLEQITEENLQSAKAEVDLSFLKNTKL